MEKIAYFILFYSLITPVLFASEGEKQKPLFSVSIDHEFVDAKKSFEEAMQLILDNYYTASINETDLYWAALKGMLRHLSPPEHPELGKVWTPAQYDKIYNSLKGVSVSIGIKSSFNATDGSLTVTEVLEGSPAESILFPNDRILRIDGHALKSKSIKEIDALLEGEVGTKVTLTVVRDVNVFDLIIKRKKFKTRNLIVSLLPSGETALLEIKKITSEISSELRDELHQLKAKNINKLILDLRNNTGGVFMESLKIAELFIPNKRVLLRTLKRSNTPQNYISSNDDPFEFNIVVLVNKKTASSCEIVAAALQDNKKAVIVGSKTYGKAVFEKTFKLENDYRVKFISGAMYTPLGKSWQSKGLTPDFTVEQTEKNYLRLLKRPLDQRLKTDSYLITAGKILDKL